MIKYFSIFNLSIFFLFSLLSIFNFDYIIAKEFSSKEVLTLPNNGLSFITNVDQYKQSILMDKKILPNHFKKFQFFSIANNLDWNQRIAWLAIVGKNGYDLDEIIPSSFPGKKDIVEKFWKNNYIPSGGIYLNNNQLVNFNVNLIMDLQMKVNFSGPTAPIDQILFFLHYHY